MNENTTTTITITINEYKELIELKIRDEFAAQITKLEAEIKAKQEDSNFWYKQYCQRNSELDALQQTVAELKTELAEYKPAEEGGDA